MKQRMYFVPVLVLALAGCGVGHNDDLKQFVQDSGNNLHGKVPPLPEVKPYQPFVYNDFDLPDPFKPRKLKFNASDSGLQPDLNRPRELLESFSLETLKMVGVIQRKGQTYGVIKTPVNTYYTVQAGNYLGQNFGKILTISNKEIKLKEMVQDAVGDWSERDSTLTLQEQ